VSGTDTDDPTEGETETDTETDTTETGSTEPALGSCENPYVLPLAPYTVRGRLLGPSENEGWCGGDGGAEDVYQVTAGYDVDVYLVVRDETEFEPVIRVEKDSCGAFEDVDTLGVVRMCSEGLAVGEVRTFFAEAGSTYSITVDSPRGTDGRYGLDILYGPPPIEACELHPSTIRQQPGGVFLWENTLGAGQGRADGPCGGPGTENMFAMEITYPGGVGVEVVGAVSVDIRGYCGGTGELACAREGEFLYYYFDEPGTYYLVADQPSHTSAVEYTLRAMFD
jgi:hypothetical protein